MLLSGRGKGLGWVTIQIGAWPTVSEGVQGQSPQGALDLCIEESDLRFVE